MEKVGHLFIRPRDWAKSFAFYTEILGFKVEQRFGDASDAGRFARFSYGNGFSMVLAEDHDITEPAKKPETYTTRGRVSLHFSTPDVDASFSRIRDGMHVIVRPENNHWGSRWFMVEDPDGNQLGWQGPRA